VGRRYQSGRMSVPNERNILPGLLTGCLGGPCCGSEVEKPVDKGSHWRRRLVSQLTDALNGADPSLTFLLMWEVAALMRDCPDSFSISGTLSHAQEDIVCRPEAAALKEKREPLEPHQPANQTSKVRREMGCLFVLASTRAGPCCA
jgi:hypothetical protein